jgi:hypothetical protein
MKAKVTLTFNLQDPSELDTVKAIFGAAGGQDPSKPDSVEVADYLASQDWVADPIVVEE